MSNFLVGTNLADVQLDKFNGDTSTVAFTLSVPSSTFSALVRISGVVQTPTDDFSIVNSTLTFTTAPPSGTNNIVVTYTKATQIGVPNDASVSASKLASNAVTTAKILDANVTTSKILDANITTAKLQDNSVSLAKLSGGTANKLMGFDGSGDPAEVDAPVSAGWAFVSSQTASTSATIAFTGMEAGYDYLVTFVNILPTTDNIAFRSRLGITGPTYRSSGYIGPVNALAATTVSQVRPTTYMQLENGQLGNAADEGAWGHMVLRDPAAVIDTNVEGMLHNHDNGSTFYNCIFGYRHTTAEAHTAIEFFMASGNISVGEFKLYRRPNV